MSSMVCFRLFETPIGVAGVAWTDDGVRGVELPEPDAARVRARLRRRFPHAVEAEPRPEIQYAIDLMSALLAGRRTDLSRIPLDLEGVPSFECQVYAVTRSIGFGQTATYGQIAGRLGDAHLAREVGQALGRNPFPIVVPCHRVIAANGKLGGFSARGGVATKQRLLAIEQANVSWQLPLEASAAT
jgi:methylated-DNA-[protein]-cysteine S-methyltransferase